MEYIETAKEVAGKAWDKTKESLSSLGVSGTCSSSIGYTNGVFILATSDGTNAYIYTSTTPLTNGSWTQRLTFASTSSYPMTLGLNQMSQY